MIHPIVKLSSPNELNCPSWLDLFDLKSHIIIRGGSFDQRINDMNLTTDNGQNRKLKEDDIGVRLI